MTDDLTPDELLEDAARKVAHLPPERIPEAEGLPEDVRDGRIEDGDEGESHPSVDHEPIVEPPED
jgi:hypothetical protein